MNKYGQLAIFYAAKMDFIIANVEHIEFKIERDLNEQYGSLPLPFPGMDSKYRLWYDWNSSMFATEMITNLYD